VLLSLTLENGLVQPALMNPILAAMVLSMLATPFLIMYSNRIVMKLVASDWLQQSLQMTTIARKSINTSKHVIICGFGRCGRTWPGCWSARAFPTWRWTWTPTACARPPLPATPWSMGMPPACRR
jgi:hypothetical protein